MPITPFHFGPGILIKSAAPRKISWAMFALANVAIDLEPIVYFVLTGDPTYITSFENARSLICRLERDEILEEIVRFYVTNNFDK